MATVNKNFRVKNGLVVEGTTGTINGSDIITEDILTGGTQTNISVTYADGVINFAAENGVADSDTDDLVEGTTNLYYTDTRVKNVIDAAITNGTQTNITVTYDDATNALSFSAENGIADATTDDLAEGTVNLYFTDQRAIDAVINGAVDTDDIEEGVSNLYYTNQRVRDVLTGSTQTNISITEVDGDLVITAENGVDDATTDDLTEGTTNLYFTDQRAVDAVINGAVDTDDIEEGTANLYFTDQRAIDAVVNGAVDTDDIEEGTTNLYFTETRARDSLSAGNGITYTAATGEIEVDTSVIADRSYVDSVAAGLTWKQAVQLLANTNIALTGNTGTLVVDGHDALVQADTGYRILLINETDPSKNGIYTYTDNGTTYTLTRSDDADSLAELTGASVFVLEGTTYANTGWVQSDHYLAAFADQDWVQFSGSGTYTDGTGIFIDGNIINVDATSDEITEGTTNLYFTDQRAIDAVVNGAVDTDDIEEGTTNLYFTNQRASDAVATDISNAIEAGDATATPTYLALDINDVAKQVAATVAATEDVSTVAYAFAKTDYRSAKFFVKTASGTHTEVTEILLTLDTLDNIAITEYAIVGTNGALSTVTAGINGSNVELLVTPASNATIYVYGTLLA